MYLLEHKMLEAASFGSGDIPVGSLHFLFYSKAVAVKELYLILADNGDLVLFQQIIVLGAVKNGCNVRGDEILSAALADDKRTFLSYGKYPVGKVTEHYSQRICTLDIPHSLGNSFNRVTAVVVVQQLCNSFRICFTFKAIAMVGKKSLQLTVVFDYTIMYNGNSAVSDGVRVYVRRLAVGSPSCVTDAAEACGLSVLSELFLKSLRYFSFSLYGFYLSAAENGNASRIITSVFKPFKGSHEKIRTVLSSYKSDNTAHDISPFFRLFLFCNYFVPYILSPASPRPGTMYSCSLSSGSTAPQYI